MFRSGGSNHGREKKKKKKKKGKKREKEKEKKKNSTFLRITREESSHLLSDCVNVPSHERLLIQLIKKFLFPFCFGALCACLLVHLFCACI